MLLPQLAMGMAEGSIAEWLVAEGAEVGRDQPMVSIETEKVVTELPAPIAGFVHLVAQVGEKLPVDSVIAKIATSKDAYEALLAGGAEATCASEREAPPASTGGGGLGPSGDAPSPLPSGAVLAPPRNESEPNRQSASTPSGLQRILASGLAKALARQHGIDLGQISGTGPGGRIVESDVLRERDRTREAAAAEIGPRRLKAKIPVAGARRAIAERMVKASTQAAQTFSFFEVDITNLLRARELLADRLGEGAPRVSLLAFYAKAVALACKKAPIVNSTLEGDAIFVWDEVNVGIAVALPGSNEFDSSLIVPVVHGVDALGVGEINERIRQQVKKARENELKPSDIAGGTITISSTDGFSPGAWSVSTPLLNLPQAVNFQPGTPVKRPVVIDDEIAIRTVLPCGLTFDHRCLDGEPVGRFVRELLACLSDAETLLA
jgi:pyruvate/2-oxoglutarate dehydrogenase complex dihydrolipoamide acyltransferase (E2) component